MNQAFKIQRSFSKSSQKYDEHSQLHRSIADELVSNFSLETLPRTILDVGCGTGYVTARLKEQWPQAKVIGVDFAQGMLEKAQATHPDIDWILADSASLPFADNHADLLVSNLSYQWAEDLAKVLAEARRVMVPGGVLAATLFGYHTCNELLDLLQETAGVKTKRLPSQVNIEEALAHNSFKSVEVRTVPNKIEFDDVYALMAWLKSIGANALAYEGFLGKGALAQAAMKYQERFPYGKGIAATFEVISIYAKK